METKKPGGVAGQVSILGGHVDLDLHGAGSSSPLITALRGCRTRGEKEDPVDNKEKMCSIYHDRDLGRLGCKIQNEKWGGIATIEQGGLRRPRDCRLLVSIGSTWYVR